MNSPNKPNKPNGLRSLMISILVLCLAMTGISGCAQNNNMDNSGGEGDAKRSLPAVTNMAGSDTSSEVCDQLTDAGLSNVSVFNEWVMDFADTAGSGAGLTDKWVTPGTNSPDIAKCMDGWERRYDYSDADCRMTAMLLLDGIITAEKIDSEYTGTYLMFDVDAIENVQKYEAIKKNLDLFTTIFGDRTPRDGEDPSEVYGRVWNEYGISIDTGKDKDKDKDTGNETDTGNDNDDDRVSLISVVCYDPDFDTTFVGHTGVLIRQAEDTYLYVEKLAFEQPYQAIMVTGTDQLMEILSGRDEYFGGEDDAGPFVYLNEQYLGELTRKE